MADWGEWDVNDTYTNIPGYEDEKDKDAVRLNDTRVTAATNLPNYAKRWNNTLGVFQNWLSSAWSAIVLAIAGGGTGATTASGARTNLGVYSTTQVDSAIDTDVAAHNAVTNPHSATSAATANRLILRDSAGRAKVATPSASTDIANKAYVDSASGTSGTYNPTYTAGSNVDSLSTGNNVMYHRVGDIVRVSGNVILDITVAGVYTTFYISLPIASDFTSTKNLVGLSSGYPRTEGRDVGGEGYLTADTSNDRAMLGMYGWTNILTIYFTFDYLVQ